MQFRRLYQHACLKRRRGVEALPAADPRRFLVWASVLAIVFVLIGQQTAFWTLDVELNMGGRYMLATLPAVAILINLGVARTRRGIRCAAWGAWIAMLIAANFVVAHRLVFKINPSSHPGWKMFDLL